MEYVKKHIICIFSMMVLLCISTLNVTEAQAGTTVTRAEWIHHLVSTFDMTVEDGLMPDDYYGDIADSEYYDDIMLAVNFGVIDLEAGEEFRPDDPATREFAAYTLNVCLGYEFDEEAKYTMSDHANLQYPQSAQIAINEGWLQLVNGAFEPEMAITVTEQSNMLNFAKNVLEASVIDENHENIYEFADDIIEIPESTPIELLSNTDIMIYDTSLKLSEGNSIAVYSNGIAYTYKIVGIEEKTEGFLITGEELDYKDAVVSVDAEGVIEADLGNFVPAEGVTVNVGYEEEASAYRLSRISGSNKISDINLKKNIGGGTVACKITNLKVYYKMEGLNYQFKTTGTAVVSCTVSGKKNFTLTLGYLNIAGVGKISVDMIYSADGSATLSYSYKFETGIEKNSGSSIRKIKNYSTPTWHFSAQAQLKTSCKVGFYIDVPGVANGSIYGEAGVKAEPAVEVYSDGKKPTMCMDLPAYIFATVGYDVKAFGVTIASETIQIYHSNNSPCRVYYHIEDGKQVNICSRPESSSRVGKLKYYTIGAAGSGTYSGNCFVAPSVAEPIFEYKLDEDNNATITKYIGSVYCLTIPEELDGYPVVAIGDNAFKGNAYLGSVVIPDGVTSIGAYAFQKCEKLENVTLSQNLTVIKQEAFGYAAIASIEIPKSLEEGHTSGSGVVFDVGDNGPFYNCEQLKTVSFEEGITEVAQCLFAGCNGIENIVVPNTVTKIEKKAFYSCGNLKSIMISDSCTSIGTSAFANCIALTKIAIPNSVTSVEAYAFNQCKNLVDVVLSKNLTVINEQAFGSTAIASIEIPKLLEEGHTSGSGVVSDVGDNGPFYNCEQLKTVSFEGGTTEVAQCLFAGCNGIENIVVPNTVTKIEKKAFYSCGNLKSIMISDSCTSIGTSAFANCIALTKIAIPNSVTSVEAYAFNQCKNLVGVVLSKNLIVINEQAFGSTAIASIEIPKSLEEGHTSGSGVVSDVGDNGPFYNCEQLKTVSFEGGTTEVAQCLFAGCNGIENIVVPNTVTKVEKKAFYSCGNLKSVTISDACTSIETSAFEDCTSLIEINIPNAVSSMGKYIFSGCTKLTKVHLSEISVELTEAIFKNCTSLIEVNIPNKVHTIGTDAFAGCTGLAKVTIPSSVQKINNSAFLHCESLMDLTISEGVTTIGENTFEYCKSLKTVTLPDSLQTLGNNALQYCETLSEVNFGAGLKVIPENCFYEDPALTKVVLPQQMTTVKKNAFKNCTKLTDITMNRRVTAIDATAFSYPDKLTIHGITGTYPETFAKENGIAFEALSAPATEIKLNKSKCQVGRNSTIQLTAGITPVDSSDELTWLSSDEEILTVDENGLVKGLKVGNARVMAMAGNVVGICEVNVYEKVTGVSISTKSKEMSIGDTLQLTATVSPAEAANKNISWSTSDDKIATVDANGLVTAVAYGTAEITVTTEDGQYTRACTVNVKPIAVTGITLNVKTATIKIGESYDLVATISPENASIKDVTWTSSAPEVATVNNGKVLGVGTGSAIIIVKTQDSSKTASCTITVGETGGEIPTNPDTPKNPDDSEPSDEPDMPNDPDVPKNPDDSEPSDEPDIPNDSDIPKNPDDSEPSGEPNVPSEPDIPQGSDDSEPSDNPDISEQPSTNNVTLRPLEITSVSAFTDSIWFEWNSDPEATGFEIQYSVNADLSNSENGYWKVGYKRYRLDGLLEGTTYYYRIRAYKGSGDAFEYSEWTAIMSKQTTVKTVVETKPQNVSAPKIKLKYVKSTKKKQMKISWKYNANVSGYQISYSRYKSFSNAKTKNINNWAIKSKTVKGLSKGKTYYVRIRAFVKDDNGKKVYGNWSGIKKVKVKKK